MHRADKAVLRLTLGLGLAVLLAYGLALTLPFVVCVMAVLVLCKPGPPIPFVKGALLALVVALLVPAGLLMVPLLEHYAAAGVALTAALLYGMFWFAGGSATPATMLLVIALTLIPIAGVAEQAFALSVRDALALGIGTGVFVSSAAHALFPDAPAPAAAAAAPAPARRDAAGWAALRATLIVMPAFILALSNPSFYLAAVMKSVAMAQQAAATDARCAGRELVGSTLAGAWMALLVWLGLSLRPSLLMLMLWLMAAALWAGARMFGVKATSLAPSFWMNALVTMLILLGPAIEDSSIGKGVLRASAIRVSVFVGVALYAWATVWVLERWQALHSSRLAR